MVGWVGHSILDQMVWAMCSKATLCPEDRVCTNQPINQPINQSILWLFVHWPDRLYTNRFPSVCLLYIISKRVQLLWKGQQSSVIKPPPHPPQRCLIFASLTNLNTFSFIFYIGQITEFTDPSFSRNKIKRDVILTIIYTLSVGHFLSMWLFFS